MTLAVGADIIQLRPLYPQRDEESAIKAAIEQSPNGAIDQSQCVPVNLGRSVQFGRTSAPTIPQRVQTMRGQSWAHRRHPATDRH